MNLTGALPDLSSNIEIKGPGADKLTVRRPDTGGDYRIFHVPSGSVVSISGITIAKGQITAAGAGFGLGGGIRNDGTLTVSDSTISGNTAGIFGGGILNGGTLTVSDSTISGNKAGDVLGSGGGDGGGIFNLQGTVTVSDSTISGNTADGGSGGGVYSDTFFGGKTTITNSTISGNTAGDGGGIYNNGGPTVIEHSTITKNTAFNGVGDGVASNGQEGSSTHTELLSTIVSANTNTDVWLLNNTAIPFVSKGYNLIGDGNATGAFNQTGDQIIGDTDPKLGALVDNGGPTMTHALLTDSPAIDAIPDTNDTLSGPTPGCDDTGITTDQRGVQRPQEGVVSDLKLRCDIGAFELDAMPPSVTINTPSGQADPTSASPIHFTAVFSEPVTGFTGSDVTLSGTAGATTAVVSGGPTTYDVAVSGMATNGTVIASIPANAAQDTALKGNTASTSTDNTVTFSESTPVPDTTSPTVTSTEPSAKARVDPTANVTATFSEDMDGDTITDSSGTSQTFQLFIKKGSTTPISATVTYDAATHVATLNPADPLQRGATYKAVVSTGVTDVSGNQLDQDTRHRGLQPKKWSFTVTR